MTNQLKWNIPRIELSAIIKNKPLVPQYAHSQKQVYQAFLSIFPEEVINTKEECHVLLLAKDGRILGTHKISFNEQLAH